MGKSSKEERQQGREGLNVEISSGAGDEPQDKGRYTEVGEGRRMFRSSVGTESWELGISKD